MNMEEMDNKQQRKTRLQLPKAAAQAAARCYLLWAVGWAVRVLLSTFLNSNAEQAPPARRAGTQAQATEILFS